MEPKSYNITKQCTLCNEVKSLDKFYNSNYGRLGVSSRCKECDKAKVYAWRKAKSTHQGSHGNDGSGPLKPQKSEN